MAAGKSTLGRLLAEALGRELHDTDHEVVERTGREVDSFFEAGEEAAFRRHEARVVEELLERGPIVIALGGGALIDPGSRDLLRSRSLLVHLHVPWADLRPRIAELKETRPLLRDRSLAEIHRLYIERLGTYRAAALRITVPQTSPAEAASRVLDALTAMGPAPAR